MDIALLRSVGVRDLTDNISIFVVVLNSYAEVMYEK